eukprot:5851105-Prymnesium_polylepis.2
MPARWRGRPTRRRARPKTAPRGVRVAWPQRAQAVRACLSLSLSLATPPSGRPARPLCALPSPLLAPLHASDARASRPSQT